MKILIDIRPLTDTHYSGVGEYVVRLLAALFALDKANEYVLFYNAWHNLEERLPQFAQSNVRFVKKKLPNKILNYPLLWFWRRPRFDKWLKEDFDIFFMPHINFMSVSRKLKSILTVHDISFLVNPEFFNWHKNIWHWFVNVKRLVKKFDYIVAVSEHTRRDLIEICNVPSERVRTVLSATDESFKVIDKTDQKLTELKNKYNLNKPFILFLSTLEPRKNIEGLIAAFALLKKKEQYREYQLVLAGGRGWKAEAIFRAIKNSGCAEDIKVLNYVPEGERVYLYNLAQVFAYPSFYEGFGFPPLEAMACGTPVVAAAASSLPEIIGDAGVLVDPYNAAAIASGLETILSDTELAKELSIKGLARAKQFSWQRAAQSYLQLFKDLCQQKTNTPR